jgi:hypothetical protein
MTQPLAGLLVLEFTTLLPGPLAALMLAEAGAEVVKIERPPAGDEMRTYLPRWGDDSTNFALLNRGKSSVALDLKDPVQKQRLMPCRLIDLDPALRDDSKDPAATTAAIAAILREKPGEYWRTLFAGNCSPPA